MSMISQSVELQKNRPKQLDMSSLYSEENKSSHVINHVINYYTQLENTSKIISPLYSMSNSLLKEPTKYECPNHQQMKAMTLSKYLYGHPPKLDNIMNINGFEPKLQLEMVKPVIDTNIIQTIQTISEEDLQTINLDQINIQLTEIEQTLQQTDFHKVLATLTNIFEKLSESINYNLENELPYQKHIVYQLRISVLLSKIYKCMGDYKNSIMWLQRIRENYRVFDPSLAGKLMLELSKLYFLNLQIRESQGILHEALLHFEKIQWKADIAKTLLLQARMCAWMSIIISVLLDNFDLATKLVYGAISLLREAYINDDTKLDQAYFILAECHYVSKKYDTAKEFLVKVIQLNLQAGKQEDHVEFLEIYNLLGLIHVQIFDLKTSYFYFCQAYKCINSNSIQKGQILNNISLIQKFFGQLELADRCQKAATEIYAQFLQENHQIFKRLLLNSIIESQQ
ncbi:unnamed protein product (macronuclear) [Paramecium tetraurelia]|uniref:MalT-like TPR region domain-containing protein n=1 Tax=Paramecium tetraurelia TaxID=5888 RepID=A0EEV7_PARTE|nr:uncharacterized protein GSPATT00026171001 [Paramecium tetraurelia]CAK93848.1 unnamed protein product [Paramecium tetraurelia]|eukprot:XP_001461221.1 hypothetical protein (macronuclear) [Paramecium tetraurelia strain d4-2]